MPIHFGNDAQHHARCGGSRVYIQIVFDTEQAKLTVSSKLLSLAEIAKKAALKMSAYYPNVAITHRLRISLKYCLVSR
jgi:hypothetical protein